MIIGGLDVGTTGCKIALYDENAKLLATYYNEYDSKHFDGQHEINFEDIKNGVLKLLKSAVKEYRVDALGVTSFGETFAMLDENDNILAPSMLYTDPRGVEECAELCEKLGKDKLTLIAGVKPHQMYSIYKLMWLKKHNADAYNKCKHVLLGEDYIVYSLTGVAQIQYSLAARTGALDVKNKCWSKEIFDAAGIDFSVMAKPVPLGTPAGTLRAEIKAELGIDYDITVVNSCHDQVAGMIGSGIFDTTSAMDGTGTVECVPVILKELPTDISFYEGGYSVVPYINNQYAVYAFSFTGGATLKWFRDNFAELETVEANKNGKNVYAELDKAVKDKPTGILILPHFAGAATPYMDTDSKAAFVGVTLETNKLDLYKALMEGTSYEMLLNFNTMKKATGDIALLKATGGGAMSDVWLQIKADILGKDIAALSCKEVGAAGAAALAGASLGGFDDLAATVAKMAPVRKVFTPNAEKTKIYAEYYKKYAKLYDSVRSLVI